MAAAILAAVVGMSAGCGKLAFDSVVQDVPDANRGGPSPSSRRAQLTWVIGASRRGGAHPHGDRPPGHGAMAGFALFSYLAGLKALDRGQLPARRQWHARTIQLPFRRPAASRPAEPEAPDDEVDVRQPGDADAGSSE